MPLATNLALKSQGFLRGDAGDFLMINEGLAKESALAEYSQLVRQAIFVRKLFHIGIQMVMRELCKIIVCGTSEV